MRESKLKVRLLTSTNDAQKTAAMAAKLCYSDSSIDELERNFDEEKAGRLIDKITDLGHLSTIEHANFTFGIEGVSRALLAQITRHRLASFSVQSQRYVSFSDGFEYVVPPSIAQLGNEAVEKYVLQMETMQSWYEDWQKELGENGEKANQDARFVLPNACSTKMIVTMNARELLHFFTLRCCQRAQWEIRELAWSMLEPCLQAAPNLFSSAGPSCLRGPCMEKSMTCGDKKAQMERYNKILSKMH